MKCFKIDIVNEGFEDKEVTLFNKQSSGSEAMTSFIGTDFMAGNPVYNPFNGLIYCPTSNAIVITDGAITFSLPLTMPMYAGFGVYNPVNQTVYFGTSNYFLVAINGTSLTEIPSPYITLDLTLAGDEVFISILDG